MVEDAGGHGAAAHLTLEAPVAEEHILGVAEVPLKVTLVAKVQELTANQIYLAAVAVEAAVEVETAPLEEQLEEPVTFG
jgi:hypothetical protein